MFRAVVCGGAATARLPSSIVGADGLGRTSAGEHRAHTAIFTDRINDRNFQKRAANEMRHTAARIAAGLAATAKKY